MFIESQCVIHNSLFNLWRAVGHHYLTFSFLFIKFKIFDFGITALEFTLLIITKRILNMKKFSNGKMLLGRYLAQGGAPRVTTLCKM